MAWISVRNWSKFQHYDPEKRVPPWIKTHTELMDDAAYLELTEHCALLLHRLWLTYASARCQLVLNTATLSRQLGVRVMTRDINRLCDAGFIEIVASKTLADGYHSASARARSREAEAEAEEKKSAPEPEPVLPKTSANGAGAGAASRADEDIDFGSIAPFTPELPRTIPA